MQDADADPDPRVPPDILARHRVGVVHSRPLVADVLARALTGQGLPALALSPDDLATTVGETEIVLLDSAVTGPDLAAIDAVLEQIRMHNAEVSVVLLSDPHTRLSQRQMGARNLRGCIDRSVTVNVLAEALLDVSLGRALPRHDPDRTTDSAVERLTSREREVLRLVAQGVQNDGIATQLSISPHTVRSHVQAILAKLEVKSRLAAATLGRQSRWWQEPPASADEAAVGQ
jgi:DNA-binding NarL/FixJ family response regulator